MHRSESKSATASRVGHGAGAPTCSRPRVPTGTAARQAQPCWKLEQARQDRRKGFLGQLSKKHENKKMLTQNFSPGNCHGFHSCVSVGSAFPGFLTTVGTEIKPG